jgi:glycosyltransferase involved in cell wall biosynthesis
MKPLVSVVVPTHNRVALLKRTLRSILGQNISDVEVIVVDDGSVDDIAAVVGDLDPRIQVLRNRQPAGVSAARNRGIAAAQGEWIAFCDDDDLWAPDKLRLQLDAMRETGRLWAYAGCVHLNPAGRISGGTPPMDADRCAATLPRWNPMPAGCSNAIGGRAGARPGRRLRRSPPHPGRPGSVATPRSRRGVPRPLVG